MSGLLRAAGLAAASGLALTALRTAAAPVRTRPPVLRRSPALIAHRGGAALAPENTMYAFRRAVEQWGADMIELDVRATADGECVVIHDETLDRTTDGSGPVSGHTLAELRQLDAAYRFDPESNGTYPLRGTGVTIPTLGEVLGELRDLPLIVEIKTGAVQAPLRRAIADAGAEHRTIIAGFHAADRVLFADYPGPSSASTEAVRQFYILHRLHLGWLWRSPSDVVNLPEFSRGRRLVTPRVIFDLRRLGIPVHVWTVNSVAHMNLLLDWGVDGILTDRPDLLGDVLVERAGRAPAPARRAAEDGRTAGRS